MHRWQCGPCADARAMRHVVRTTFSLEFTSRYFPGICLNRFGACVSYGQHTAWTLICIYHQIKRTDGPLALAAKGDSSMGTQHVVTMLPGEGTGPELCEAVQLVIDPSGVNIKSEL